MRSQAAEDKRLGLYGHRVLGPRVENECKSLATLLVLLILDRNMSDTRVRFPIGPLA
jgi:hypothetical protein